MDKLTVLQKELVLWICFCLVVVFSCSLYIGQRENQYEGIIRFHVLANSDSKEDQQLKLQVRNKVVGTLEKEIARQANKEGFVPSERFTRNYVKNNLNRINKIAFDTVRSKGYKYKTEARLGVTYIPEKSYGDLDFPAGNYEALNITIGSGRGHNWFCVIYPPLCLIKKSNHRSLKLKWKIFSILKKGKFAHQKTTRYH